MERVLEDFLKWIKQIRIMITILGAGVSGLTAAIVLAKEKDVNVYEIGKRPKPNFDIVVHSFRNYGFEKGVLKKLEKTGIKLPKLYPIYKVYKYSPSLNFSEITSKQPIFYSFLRGNDPRSLDSVLLKQAEKNGVNVFFGQTKKDADIIATGAKRVDGVAFGYHYEGLNIEKAVYTFYDNRYSPKGYLYVLPFGKNRGDVVTTSFCSPKDYPNIKKYFEKAVKENKILQEITDGAEKICEVRGFGNFNIPFSAIKKKKLYIGEAAEFQDASKGFGVKFAILSGYSAAVSILKNQNYDTLWKKEFKNELIYYFKRRIGYQFLTNQNFENYISKLGKKCTKEYEESLKKKSIALDILYPFKLLEWKLFKKI